jgi:cytochrome oxidase Cu insertion factor (SCO1/SenC/PrrC family)
MRAPAALLLVMLAAAGASAEERAVKPEDLAYVYGVGRFSPEYAPPEPGTYTLPPIDDVTDHPLIDSDGRPTTLYALTRDRVAVIAFVYTTCSEATGCPVSTAVLHRLDGDVAADPALRPRVRLVSISFDPERDTPSRLASVRALHEPHTDWAFATAPDETRLAPLLADFGQPVARLRFDDGRWTGLYRHVLKVFLVDQRHRVRNVYSTGFLHPELILNDVRTVLLEDDAAVRSSARAAAK